MKDTATDTGILFKFKNMHSICSCSCMQILRGTDLDSHAGTRFRPLCELLGDDQWFTPQEKHAPPQHL